MSDGSGWQWACPECRARLQAATKTVLRCTGCDRCYERREGIWHLMTPERAAVFERFLEDYTRIRLAEGRGAESEAYYLGLPGCDREHPVAWQWRIRRCTYGLLTRRVLPNIANGSLRVVDIGAGVGWLSHRLAEAGHSPCAMDLSVDRSDGLGAARFYPGSWPRVRAEFDRIPLGDGSVDCVIFNASLHYSADYAITLGEALRVAAPGGRVLVVESPIYRRDESGRRMAEERHRDFERRYGTRSDALGSREYLTWQTLDDLAAELGIRWTVHRPWYGLAWALRPWRARLLGRREPSTFAILVGERASAAEANRTAVDD